MRRVALVPALVLALATASTAAQAQLAPADSLRILGQAHSAQSRFEITRRMNLPKTAPYDTRETVATIGRMDYWPDNDTDDPIAEPSVITRARAKLIATLTQLSQQSRADEWIAGQRVRYMVEAGEDSASVVAARECWATKWWCDALLGYALHSAGRYREAEMAYDSSLAAMPEPTRCKWRDISLLLDGEDADRYAHMSCDARVVIEKRFWDLAQPSYAIRGNDRRTEHFSRVFVAELLATSSNPYGLVWGNDLRELTIRYGQPSWYTSAWARSYADNHSSTEGHNRHPSFHFAAAMDGDSAHWDVTERKARERYSPAYLDTVVDLDAQFALMKRGDSALVVTAYADTTHPGDAVLGVGMDERAALVVGDSASHRRVRRARAAWKGLVVGVEKLDASTHRLARARAWIMPPVATARAPQLSTLLLFAPDTSRSIETLDDALASALTANELSGSRKLGLYWEMYGASTASPSSVKRDSVSADSIASDSTRRDSTAAVATLVANAAAASADTAQRADTSAVALAGRDSTARAVVSERADTLTRVDTAASVAAASGDASDVSITVARVDGGVMRWLTNTLRITRTSSPVAVHWHDGQTGDDIAARSVVLDLAQLPAGKYRVTLAVGPDDAHQTSTSREIRLR